MESSEPPLSVAKPDMILAAAKIASNTVITNLNDDCLLEVFKHLALLDLFATADVCSRFRANARTRLAFLKLDSDGLRIECSSSNAKISLRSEYSSEITRVMYFNGDVPIHKVLRFFGYMINSIRISSGSNISAIRFAKSVFDRIRLHCSGTLIDLDIVECAIDVRIELAVRPLLSNLQKLSLDDSEHGALIGPMLSLCSSLRELRFRHTRPAVHTSEAMQFDDILRQYLPKVELISFEKVSRLENTDIRNFLERNPQLKKIELRQCENIDDGVLLFIAAHTPRIEAIHLNAITIKMNSNNIKYFGKFIGLSTLKLEHTAYMPLILHEINQAKIPLENLHIKPQWYPASITRFVDVLFRLKTLKTLWLIDVPGLTLSNAIDLCKHLEHLTEIILPLSRVQLVSLGSEFVELAQTIAQRRKNTPLVFKVKTTEANPFEFVPEDLRKIYKDKLKLKAVKENSFPCFDFL